MNKNIFLILVVSVIMLAPDALARDTRHRFSIADVMENAENASQLEGVSFYFGEQSHPAIKKNHGEFRTNKKTNAFNKSDLQACERAMMSALLQLYQRAQSLGVNAVINIKSNYKDNVVSSETEYVCGAGALVAGVALIGTFVEVEEE
jgi:uncharacterized protein YbjQ (UPF0145 family)